MTIHSQLVPVFEQQVRALIGQIDKAASWCADQGMAETDFLESRLAADMFPLAKQLDFVVAQMLQPLRRLSGSELPDPAPAEPIFADHQRRLREALDAIAQVGPENVDDDPLRMVAMELPNGMAFDLCAADYVCDWALPQFWFHIVTAYAIMRMHGVPLGKADLVPHMGRHARRPGG